jgi:hypothetical protein
LETQEARVESLDSGRAEGTSLRPHRGLAAPTKVLRRLDRQVGRIFTTRYPARYADWFYSTAIRWIVVPVVAGSAISVITTLLHLSRWIALAGECLWIAGLVVLGLGTLPAVLQQYWQMARAIADTENRRVLVMAREDAAYRRLRVIEPEALRLCRRRCFDALATLTALPLFPITVAGMCMYWVGPDALRNFVGLHHEAAAWCALVSLTFAGFVMIIGASLRRHVYLLTLSLGEDPHDLRLPSTLSWLKSLRGGHPN